MITISLARPPSRLTVVLLLIFVIALMALGNPALSLPYQLIENWLHVVPNETVSTLRCAPYAIQMVLRLAWWLFAVAVVYRYDREILAILRFSKLQWRYFFQGLPLGFAVMCGVILAIVVSGDADLSRVAGSMAVHIGIALAWLASEILGAVGEEILYRALILLLVARLFGPRVAIVISAVAFAVGHLANPGVSAIWIIRLFAAGMLLGYSVIRSGSLWWAVGYHAGWNFASAPLFGAAGSGFNDEGSQFQFAPSGSDWITGGAVGPEGSVFAFVAVAFAAAVMLKTLPARSAAAERFMQDESFH